MSSLPPELAPWGPILSEIAAPLAVPLGHMARKLDAAIGPLRPRIPLPGGEPDGYRGLSRRGPYDRLLLSEWALLDEAPDEFVRRASEKEHAFLQLDHRSPRQGIRCEAVFDAGPESLGSPRIAHIALLIVLARRAEIAGAEFVWSVAQRPGAIHSGLNGQSLRALLDGRSGQPFVAPPEGPGKVDERWFVGGSATRGQPGVIAAVVTDVIAPDVDEVCVSVERPGRTPATIHLMLPPADSRRQLVLDATARPRPARIPNEKSVDGAELRTFPAGVRGPWEVRFLYGSQQFAAMFGTGQMLIWSLANAHHRRVRKAQVQHGLGASECVAVGYAHQRPLSVVRPADDVLRISGQRPFGIVPSATLPTRGRGRIVAIPFSHGEHDRRLFTDGNARLWSLYRTKGEPEYRLRAEQMFAEDIAVSNEGGWVFTVRVSEGRAHYSVLLIRADGNMLAELPVPGTMWGKFTHAYLWDHQYVGLVTIEGDSVVGRGIVVSCQSGSPAYALRFLERGRVQMPTGKFVGAAAACLTADQRTEVAAVAYDTEKGVFRRNPDGASFAVPREPLGAQLAFNGQYVGFYTAEGTVELWSFATGRPMMLRVDAP